MLTSLVALRECPPSSKKLSFVPTFSKFSISQNDAHIFFSVSVFGSTYSLVILASISGSARLSSLPFLVTGIASICIMYAGTMYSGSSAIRLSLMYDGVISSSLVKYAYSALSPVLSVLAMTALSFIFSSSRMRLSISPGSIRNPLIFTCSSIRPRYSIFPSESHIARSPVRYIFPSPNGESTNFSAVCSGLFRYPLANPAPVIHSSPGTPIPQRVFPSIM